MFCISDKSCIDTFLLNKTKNVEKNKFIGFLMSVLNWQMWLFVKTVDGLRTVTVIQGSQEVPHDQVVTLDVAPAEWDAS